MRTYKGFGIVMLVAVLVVGIAVMASAKKGTEAAVSVNASFSIPSWISLSAVGNGNVSFSDIAGPGSYAGSNETQLQVLSTTSWNISEEILWSESKMPEGASQTVIENALSLSFSKAAGSWGVHKVEVSYEMDVADDDMADLPVGDYNLVIQYTATTD